MELLLAALIFFVGMMLIRILSAEARQLIELSVRRMQVSARSHHRILKLSRTIADLGDSDRIEVQHAAEAIQYRPRQQVM